MIVDVWSGGFALLLLYELVKLVETLDLLVSKAEVRLELYHRTSAADCG